MEGERKGTPKLLLLEDAGGTWLQPLGTHQ